MGLFGFGNFTKEGPGVRRDEPQKKPFFRFWDILVHKFWNLLVLGMLYIVCCLPIVTIGPATAGFVYVMRNYVLGRPVFLKDDFFEAFRKNWKQSVLVWFFTTVVVACDSFAIYFYAQNLYTGTGDAATVNWFGLAGFAVSLSILLIVLFMNFYIYLMIVTFDFPFKALVKNSFIFAGVGLFNNFLVVIASLLFMAVGVALIFFHYTLPLGVVYLLLLTAPFCGLLVVFNAFPMLRKHIIDPYYEEQGLPNPLDPVIDDSEAIFADDVTQRALEEERQEAMAEKRAEARKAFGLSDEEE